MFWKAPESGSGCVAFRATVLEQRDLWYMDDGDLTKVLCEEVSESEDMQPAVLHQCCACDEAKYEVCSDYIRRDILLTNYFYICR